MNVNFMKLNTTLVLSLFLLLGACVTKTKESQEAKAKKTNLLFIMTDQQRFDALRIAGNRQIITPNLDKLAGDGAFFTNAYTPCPVCVPARASILTGFSNENTRVTNNSVAYAEDQNGVMPMTTFDEVLAENGYTCAYFGKWHAPLAKGAVYMNELPAAGLSKSEYGRGMKLQYTDYLDVKWPIRPLEEGEYYDTFSGRPYKADPIDPQYGKDEKVKVKQNDLYGELTFPAEHSVTAFHGRQTIEALEQLKDKPFSITCSFNPPHAPMVSVKKYRDMYNVDELTIPNSIHDPMDNSPYRTTAGRLKYTEYADEHKVPYMVLNYYALVTEIDEWVGKILSKLDELGLSDNTLVIFTSDHGEMLGAHGMRGKFNFYEESAHIPLLIKYPGEIKKSTKVDGYVSTVDLYATILDYLKIDPIPSDGSSLRDMIEQKPTTHGEYVVIEWLRDDKSSNYMVLSDGWKLICGYVDNANMMDALYNLKDDPYETINLLGNNPDRKKYDKKVEELKAQLIEWLEKTGSKNLEKLKNRKTI
ncbi:MAG: sulfatase-like hydrolase/transferase [Cyclobacteriaceae bacterium]